ncbi:GNAT family N-acetyltransferase [Antribacter sp. KLBMP9083]|uniref:GNAT family N-acetyltransferase n=1 Tax=Antribacter soli TaxID=2910976 RepID=A0AA41QEV4_9MICO|nr:GNAT family protein [Antribacter soli]MCF4121853.1 GNAT family N-acetyltransferase [Antribacter soli]
MTGVPPDVLELAGEPPAHLRALVERDWPLEAALSRVSDVTRWTYYPPGMSEEEARTRAARSAERRAEGVGARYVLLSDGVPAGTAGIGALLTDRPEVFYSLLPAGRGHGLATRAATALAAWALGAGYPRVALLTLPGNAASEAVAGRAGFVESGEETGEDGRVVRVWLRGV